MSITVTHKCVLAVFTGTWIIVNVFWKWLLQFLKIDFANNDLVFSVDVSTDTQPLSSLSLFVLSLSSYLKT